MARHAACGFALATVLLASLAQSALAGPALCVAFRVALRRVASAGLAYTRQAGSNGAFITLDRGVRFHLAQEAVANATLLLSELEGTVGTFGQHCLPGDEEGRAAAEASHALFLLLFQDMKASTAGVVGNPAIMQIFEGKVSWSGMLHSGWPVFQLAAFVEHQVHEAKGLSPRELLDAYDASEDCSADQEEFRQIGVMYTMDGHTFRIMHVRQFLRDAITGDAEIIQGPRFLLDLLYNDAKEPGRCPVALALGFAATADALQCHWHRPWSRQTHELLDAAVERAQLYASKAFEATGMRAVFAAHWPLLSFLARLEPPFPLTHEREGELSPPVAVVSYSSREQELGGLNWAEHFVEEVFSGRPGVEVRPDMECSDIFVFRSKKPENFGGVLVFVDGERCPEDSYYYNLLTAYPASIVVGPRPASGLGVWFPVPYASTHFASRTLDTPRELALPAAQRRGAAMSPPEGRRFAGYLAFKCWEHRERFFHLLDQASEAAGLGGVTTLSRCGKSSATEPQRKKERYSSSYMDDAVEMFSGYRFALVFENNMSPRYVTEKIVNAFLAGAIPIYWGSPFVHRLFNPRAFIYAGAFLTFEDAARRVVEVALDPAAYSAMLAEPALRNTSAARHLFSWHRSAERENIGPGAPVESLRDQIAEVALEKYRAGLRGQMPAIERRPWDYADLFRVDR